MSKIMGVLPYGYMFNEHNKKWIVRDYEHTVLASFKFKNDAYIFVIHQNSIYYLAGGKHEYKPRV